METTKTFSSWIIEDLQKKSGLSTDTIDSMAISELSTNDQLIKIRGTSIFNGQSILNNNACYSIPYRRYPSPEKPLSTVTYDLKLQKRLNQGKVKYLRPKKTAKTYGSYLYFLPDDQKNIADGNKPICITEGAKKTAKLWQETPENIASIGLQGVACWKCNDLQLVKFNGRDVYLFWDADYQQKPEVAHHMFAFYLWLLGQKANVKFCTWPGDAGKGIDDYLVIKEKEGVSPQDEITSLMENATSNPFEIISPNYEQLISACCSVGRQNGTFQTFFKRHDLSTRYDTDWKDFKTRVNQAIKVSEYNKQKKDLRPWEEPNLSGGPPKIITGVAARCYVESKSGDLIYTQDSFYQYAKGVWSELPENEIKKDIQEMIGEKLAKRSIIEDIIYQVESNAYKGKNFEFNKSPWLLNFSNCVIDISGETPVKKAHSREDYFNYQFPYNYEQSSDCDEWLKFLDSLGLEQDTITRLQEWIGYCLTPIVKIQKCLFLKGEGANGKSTFLEVVIALLGEKNVSSLEIVEMFERFKVAYLQGKMANICTDVDTRKAFDTRFYKLVCGELQMAEQKNGHPFEFRSHAKIIFSANNFLRVSDRSHGFFRRFDIVEFPKIFEPHEQNPNKADELKYFLPGIANWAIAGLMRLKKNNWKLSKCESVNETLEEFKEAGSPLLQFISERCEKHTTYEENTETFRIRFKNWCLEREYRALSPKTLSIEMRRLNFVGGKNGKCLQRGTGPQRYRVFSGIRLID